MAAGSGRKAGRSRGGRPGTGAGRSRGGRPGTGAGRRPGQRTDTRSGRRPDRIAGSASFGADLARAVVIALFLISVAVVFVLYFRPLYYLDIRLLHLETASGKDAVTIRRNYDALCDYLFFWNRSALFLPDFPMSEHGRIHFADCKRIFDVVQILAIVTGILTLAGAVSRKHTARCLRIAGILAIVLPAAAGSLAFFQWDALFETFHTILFRNDYWLFDPRYDPVILILPDRFFFQCAVVILAVILAGGILCLLSAHRKAGDLRP